MTNTKNNFFSPDYAIHPGEILDETLESRGIKKTVFAEKCGISNKTVSLIIHGKSSITPEMAIKFERALGTSASLWINLNTDYDLHLARKTEKLQIIKQKEWINKFPVAQLINYGIIPKRSDVVDSITDLLSFFGVANISAWNDHYLSPNVAYRKSATFKGRSESVATWLRIGEKFSEQIDCSPFDKENFKNSLTEIRALTTTPIQHFQKEMIELCKKSGVALVFVPEFPKTHISGVTKWLTKDKAMIILSLRHKMEDHFWFSFFHEAAHILLHGKTDIFIENNKKNSSKKELEADKFASNILIPPSLLTNFVKYETISHVKVCELAEKINLSPGILVGRLQHDKIIPYTWLNKLKKKLEFSTVSPTIA